MASFSSYAKEFSRLFRSATNNIITARTSYSQELAVTIDDEITQLVELLEQMDVSAISQEDTKKCKELGKAINTLKQKARAITSKQVEEEERAQLITNPKAIESTSKIQQNKFSEVTKKLKDSDQYIDSSIIAMNEAISTSADVLVQLDAQKSQIIRARSNVERIQDGITSAFKKTRDIARNISLEKVVVGAIIAVLVITMVLIIWIKFAPHSNPYPYPNPTPEPNVPDSSTLAD